MIDQVTWNTGSNGNTIYDKINTINFYSLERSNNIGKICSGSYCNDTITRTTSWVGQVGLIYPSDYGYATSGGSTNNRDTCLKALLNYFGSTSNCRENDWLYKGQIERWAMTPVAHSQAGYFSFAMSNSVVVQEQAANALNVFPAIYLKTNVKIENGNGSSSSPYYLSI